MQHSGREGKFATSHRGLCRRAAYDRKGGPGVEAPSEPTVVPARAGEVARVQWMARRTGLPRASIAGSIILDYLVNAAGLLGGLVALPFLVAVPTWLRGGIILTLALFGLATLLVMAARPTGS